MTPPTPAPGVDAPAARASSISAAPAPSATSRNEYARTVRINGGARKPSIPIATRRAMTSANAWGRIPINKTSATSTANWRPIAGRSSIRASRRTNVVNAGRNSDSVIASDA